MKFAGRWIITLMLITFAARLSALDMPYESWMGAYVGDRKVGYLCYKVDKGEYEGTQGYRVASVLNYRLTVLGVELTQLVTSVVYTDANYNPVAEDFAMSSGGKTTRIRATMKEKAVECLVSAGSGSSNQTVPIPEGASLVGDAMFALLDCAPEVGKQYSLYYFNPLTLSVDPLKIKVEKKEKIKVGGKEYETDVLKNLTPMGEMIVWQDTSGDIVQVNAMMNIKMVKESREQAMVGVESGKEVDFAVLTSVKPNTSISSPRKVKTLDIILKGISDDSMALSDPRQTVAPVDGKPGQYLFSITVTPFDSAKALKLPIPAEGFDQYLTSSAYLDCNIKEVKNQAKAIVGDETNSYAACAKIRKWIYASLKPRADIGITRAASDVLKSKVGVCRDYAILFAALARSVGIPSRVVSGLLYTDGAFYYHAWVECNVGQWVSFDATLPSDFVDATHIKLAEGDATSMFALSKVIGSLKVDVKDYK